MFRIFGHACARSLAIATLGLSLGAGLYAADSPKSDTPKPGEPTDAKARKTYAEAIEWQKHRNDSAAIDDFRKANKQDGGHCSECLKKAYLLAIHISDFKQAEDISREFLAVAQTSEDKAEAHYRMAIALQRQGLITKKDKCFADSCDEFKTALELDRQFSEVHYAWGISLARLHQDEQARTEFAAYLDKDRANSDLHERAKRYMERIDLARATMAPPFSVTTLDGQHLSMDSLAGKVVLIDFWATWCGPCREALPHIRSIAARFAGQPFVVLSISLDKDEAKWKDFVAKNGMTWLQYRDGGFEGGVAKQFAVTGIPATFTIDADGVLEDQHVGDADIEGKLKKLIARTAEVANRKSATAIGGKSALGAN
jgi:thiol-disulfide isomerase/thioredoxin